MVTGKNSEIRKFGNSERREKFNFLPTGKVSERFTPSNRLNSSPRWNRHPFFFRLRWNFFHVPPFIGHFFFRPFSFSIFHAFPGVVTPRRRIHRDPRARIPTRDN